MTDINKQLMEQELNESFGNLATLKLGKMTAALRQSYRAGQTRNDKSTTGGVANKVAANDAYSPLKTIGDNPVITNVGMVRKWGDITKLFKKDGEGANPLVVTLHHLNKPVMMIIGGRYDVSDGANAVIGLSYDFSGFNFDQTVVDGILKNTYLEPKTTSTSRRTNVQAVKTPGTSQSKLITSTRVDSYDKLDKWKKLTGNTSNTADKEFNNYQMWKAAVMDKFGATVSIDLDDVRHVMVAKGRSGTSEFDLNAKKGTVKDVTVLFDSNDNINMEYGQEENLFGVALQVKEVRQIFEEFVKAAGVSLDCNIVQSDPTAREKNIERRGKMGSLPLSNERLSKNVGRYGESGQTLGQSLLNDRLTKFKSERITKTLVDYGTDAGKLFAALKADPKKLETMFMFAGGYYKKEVKLGGSTLKLMVDVMSLIRGTVESVSSLELPGFPEYEDATGTKKTYSTLEFVYKIKDGKAVPSHIRAKYKDHVEGL